MGKKQAQILVLLASLSTVGMLAACSNTMDSITDSESTSALDSSNVLTASYEVDCDTSSIDESSNISDTLYGIFLEDINFAVDGGIYAELIKNRSFEYGSIAANEGMHGWLKTSEDALTFYVSDGSSDESYLNENNTHFAVLINTSDSYEGIGNVGFLEGMSITADETYSCSLYAKSDSGYGDSIRISLENIDGTVYDSATIDSVSDSWQKYEVTLTPEVTVSEDVRLQVEILNGSICLDMVSLLPEYTYCGLNIRQDIGEYLESLNPSFLRFPGGCVIEGKDEESIYSWKDSIGNGMHFEINGEDTVGDVATRPQGKDIWSGNKNDPYYTTYGIGFYEYFELCEALDCLPVPVLNAGMTCEVQSSEYLVYDLDSDEFKQCVQDALDLVEFCLGDADTYWGSVRIAMGHVDPFTLKYIAIGNEQWQTEYHEHYEAFVAAFAATAERDPALYGNIELIVANGTSSSSSEGWDYVEENPDDLTTPVDEHYYETPEWFLTNTTRYDSYDRSSSASVFLGEYAAQSNTLEAALAEAAFMTGLERNGDVVTMACYAPLFGNSKTNQWTPDMIFFSNSTLYGSVNYYVQKMFSNNVGTTLLTSTLDFENNSTSANLSGAVGLGSWMTSVSYDNFKVLDDTSNEILYETDFSSTDTLKEDGWNINDGEWDIENGALVQTNTASPFDTNTGDSIYIGESDWSNYTLTVDATILDGDEGFLIPICVENSNNNMFWNLGGWENTVSCLQTVSDGTKSGQISGTVKSITLKKNQTYELTVTVTDSNIKCYVDGSLYINYTYATASRLYETASIDENGTIILKYVNVSDTPITITNTLDNFDSSQYDTTAVVTTLSGTNPSDLNSFDTPTNLVATDSGLPISEEFDYVAPAYSVSIVCISQKK